MKKITEQKKKMSDWDNELRFNSANYSDYQVVDIAQKAIDCAYDGFKDKETVFDGFEYEYEKLIENVALGIESHLQININNKKSTLLKDFILSIIDSDKYGRGRSGFIYLLSILKMDEDLKRIASDKRNWEIPRIRFQLLYALYKRKIKGFSIEAGALIENFPRVTELRKYAKKYIEQEKKW